MPDPFSENDPDYLRNALVDSIKQRYSKISAPVEETLRTIARHHFLPGFPLSEAYSDDAIVTQRINGMATSSSSQPSLMAIMLDQLHLQPGHRVLEIGAGTGYNAALIARIVGEIGSVVTIEIDAEIADRARKLLDEIGTRNVKVVAGDGINGYAGGAPYNRIILTAAAPRFSLDWWDQLAPDGLFVGPLFLRNVQVGLCFRKRDDRLINESIIGVGFVSLRNAADDTIRLPQPNLKFAAGDSNVDLATVGELLRVPNGIGETGVTTSLMELGILKLWLAVRCPQSCTLATLDGESASDARFPHLVDLGANSETFGLVSASELCLLGPPSSETPKPGKSFEICLYSYGSGSELRQKLREEIVAWDQRGRGLKKAPKIVATRDRNTTGSDSATHRLQTGGLTYLVDWI